MFRLYFTGFMALGLGGIVVVAAIDRAVNFTPVQARVELVQSECRLESVERGVLVKTTLTSKHTFPCKEAESLKAEDPDLKNFNVIGQVNIDVSYTSPVDNKRHFGVVSYDYSRGKTYLDKTTGDPLPVLASKFSGDSVMAS